MRFVVDLWKLLRLRPSRLAKCPIDESYHSDPCGGRAISGNDIARIMYSQIDARQSDHRDQGCCPHPDTSLGSSSWRSSGQNCSNHPVKAQRAQSMTTWKAVRARAHAEKGYRPGPMESMLQPNVEPTSANRVSDVFAQAQQDEEAARKAVAHISIWIFIALLIGAFCASYAATVGGRQRDHMKPI